MKSVESTRLRNVALIGHGATGKTSLVEAMMYLCGVTNRMGRVEDGNTVSDFEAEEKSRGYSISATAVYCDWKKQRVNLVDAPGGANFVTEALWALQVADAALITICAASGVEVQTERFWNAAAERNLPRAFFVNKLDRERADFDRTLDDIRESFKISVVPLTIPIGQEAGFAGVVDVLEKKAYKFNDKGEAQPIDMPGDLTDRVEELRIAALEAIAENDEALMEKYLGGEELTHDEIFSVLKKAVAAGAAYPVLCGSAIKNAGLPFLLDLCVDAFPSPLERPAAVGKNPRTNTEETRESSPDAPFSAIVFKNNSLFAGGLSVARVLSGEVGAEGTALNPNTGTQERMGGLVKIQGKNTENLERAVVGDIVGLTKLKHTRVGDTLCDEKHEIVYDLITVPPPRISFSVHPKVKGDEDKVIGSLLKIAEDDPTLRVVKDAQTHEVVLSGMGTGHIEVTMEKLARRYKQEAELGLPKIPYLETVKGKATTRYRHRKQSGGRGQFGECEIIVAPLPRGGGYEFHDKIVGGVIPKTFIPAVDKGIREASERGPVAGFPTVDFQVDLVDGKTHDVDSSEQAFKMAGSMAFKEAVLKANPTLLEPVYKMEIVAPEENTGDIMGDLSSRRGQVQGFETIGKNTVVRAMVPLAEILRYEPDLRSMTSGRGAYLAEFDHYQELPHELAQKIIEQAKKDRDEE
ncbi:elongation factor G [bacterium]|nr:elongation factor G [bacterium]